MKVESIPATPQCLHPDNTAIKLCQNHCVIDFDFCWFYIISFKKKLKSAAEGFAVFQGHSLSQWDAGVIAEELI